MKRTILDNVERYDGRSPLEKATAELERIDGSIAALNKRRDELIAEIAVLSANKDKR